MHQGKTPVYLIIVTFILSFSILALAQDSYRINAGDELLIEEHDALVENTCSSDIFVPSGSMSEWDSFYNNHPNCINIDDCSWTGWTNIANSEACCDEGSLYNFQSSGSSVSLYCCG